MSLERVSNFYDTAKNYKELVFTSSPRGKNVRFLTDGTFPKRKHTKAEIDNICFSL